MLLPTRAVSFQLGVPRKKLGPVRAGQPYRRSELKGARHWLAIAKRLVAGPGTRSDFIVRLPLEPHARGIVMA
jgi:hypothetical protein